MIKFLLEEFLAIVLGLIIITQVLVPCFVKDLKFFWLFRKPDDKVDPPAPESIVDRIKQTKETATELRNTADIIFDEAAKIKDEADSI